MNTNIGSIEGRIGEMSHPLSHEDNPDYEEDSIANPFEEFPPSQKFFLSAVLLNAQETSSNGDSNRSKGSKISGGTEGETMPALKDTNLISGHLPPSIA